MLNVVTRHQNLFVSLNHSATLKYHIVIRATNVNMCCARLSKEVLLLTLTGLMTYAYVGPFMSEMTFHTAYISTNCARLIKVSYAQCVKAFAESDYDLMNYWRLATLCELCSTPSIKDTSGHGSIDKEALGSLKRYKYFVGK